VRFPNGGVIYFSEAVIIIYMVGFSNGGMLAYRFAAEKGDILSAFATVAATIGSQPSGSAPLWRIPKPEAPLPSISFHGLSDDTIPLEGGVSQKHGGDRSFLSLEVSTKFWVHNNGCDAEPVFSNRRQKNVHIQTWKGCRQDASVELYLIENWGHFWPGQYYTKDLDKENPLNEFDAAAIIWDFFQSHSKAH
jgi:polyhydroxybutyrate depolymerase